MNQSLENLTLTDLENLIESIVKKVLKEEKVSHSKDFLKTAGTWQDERTAEEIIKEIYESRNRNLDYP